MWRGGWRGTQQSRLVGTGDRVLTRMHMEVAQDAGDVGVDGAVADEEDIRDLAVRLSVRHEIEHLMLTSGQRGEASGAAPPRLPRGLVRHLDDRLRLSEQRFEREVSAGIVDGVEPLFS